jgi:hypothetical protein
MKVLVLLTLLAATASVETSPHVPQSADTQATAGRAELVERTMAIVAGAAITLSDVRTAMDLGLIEASGDVAAATERLVERALVLREVERYAPIDPDPARINERLDALRARLGTERVAQILTTGGFTDARLRGWIRDDLRIAAYLEQRFAADGPERRESLIDDWVNGLRQRTPVVELWKK